MSVTQQTVSSWCAEILAFTCLLIYTAHLRICNIKRETLRRKYIINVHCARNIVCKPATKSVVTTRIFEVRSVKSNIYRIRT
jgi:hypothetical protein